MFCFASHIVSFKSMITKIGGHLGKGLKKMCMKSRLFPCNTVDTAVANTTLTKLRNIITLKPIKVDRK